MKEKVIVGLSGGVDSSVAAFLLKKQGFNVLGVTLKLFDTEELIINKENICCNKNDISDAKKLCENLGISHKVLDFGKSFKKNVIDYFISSYKCGETPNPCVICNRTVKFAELLAEADKNKNAFIATGHYAKIGYDNASKRYFIKKGTDEKKDQSYVLYGLGQELLSRIIFPLGDFSKDEIRNIAREAGISSFEKKDSQDICFIPEGDYVKFIKNYTGETFEKGNFISSDGKILGKHNGIIGYTIGQRKGLGISSEEPYYVLNKNISENTVILGREPELYSKRFTVKNVNFMPFECLETPIRLKVKTRYKQKEKEATIFPLDKKTVEIEFDEKQRAITPGQSAVFYDGDIVVGGGIIEKTKL